MIMVSYLVTWHCDVRCLFVSYLPENVDNEIELRSIVIWWY